MNAVKDFHITLSLPEEDVQNMSWLKINLTMTLKDMILLFIYALVKKEVMRGDSTRGFSSCREVAVNKRISEIHNIVFVSFFSLYINKSSYCYG